MAHGSDWTDWINSAVREVGGGSLATPKSVTYPHGRQVTLVFEFAEEAAAFAAVVRFALGKVKR